MAVVCVRLPEGAPAPRAASGSGASSPGRGAEATTDPFAPGLRWSSGTSGPGAPTPAAVSFAGGGELVLGAAAHGAAELALFASGGAPGEGPLRSDPSVAAAVGPLRVAARGHALFASLQVPAPDALHRRTLVRGYGTAPSPMAPAWEHDPGVVGNGAHLLELDPGGGTLVAAVYADAAERVQVDWLDAATGGLAARAELAAPSLRALAVAEGGARVALAAGAEVYVLERTGSSAASLYAAALPVPTLALDLASDGRSLAFGRGQDVVVSAEGSGGFAEVLLVPGGAGAVPVCAALSAKGGTVAAGFWDALTGRSARYELWDVGGSGHLTGHAESNPEGGPQNYPAGLALAGDGSRAALGFWGGGGAEPEVVLLPRDGGGPLLCESLPGSVLALDLDPTGTRVAAAAKAEHAGVLAAGGALHLFDTGERDLQVLGAPTPGGSLELVLAAGEVAHALFLFGSPLGGAGGAGTVFPSVAGALQLDPFGLALSVPADWVAGDRAGLALPLPPLPGLVGAQVEAQALAASVGGALAFSAWTARPAVL